MIRLPTEPRLADRRAFAAGLGTLLGLLAMAIGIIGTGEARPGVAILVAVSVAVSGWFFPGLIGRLYEPWNWLARRVGAAASMWVGWVAYLVLAVAGRAGSDLPVAPPSPTSSGWRPRRPGSGSSDSQSMNGHSDAEARGWFVPLLLWARSPSNWWVWAISPFLVFLAALQQSPKSVVSTKNYTLY